MAEKDKNEYVQQQQQNIKRQRLKFLIAVKRVQRHSVLHWKIFMLGAQSRRCVWCAFVFVVMAVAASATAAAFILTINMLHSINVCNGIRKHERVRMCDTVYLSGSGKILCA